MKIDWQPSEAIKQRAIKISELKEKGYTYAPLRDLFGFTRSYIIALKKLGDELRKEKNESNN